MYILYFLFIYWLSYNNDLSEKQTKLAAIDLTSKFPAQHLPVSDRAAPPQRET